ncbi:sugar ABC transporter permease [Clostridia bacterium]|nr:sugar ABC transporter permease [Clostridia bacterium]
MAKRSSLQKAFNVGNILFMSLLVVVTLYPLYYVLVASFTSSSVLEAHRGLLWWPPAYTYKAYQIAFSHPLLVSGFRNILVIMGVSLPLSLITTVLCAYFMSSKGMMFKKLVMYFMLFTMFFSGGLIPSYLNINRLGLYNSLWALILPSALSLYNAIITKTAMESIPDSLTESAFIDGANDLVILFRILVPLILPTLAVMALYYGVGQWNSWFTATIYIKDNKNMPIQAILRGILIANQKTLDTGMEVVGADYKDTYAETIKYAVIIISTVPILLVYPFLQKYFVKGVMIGAVKG